MTFVQMFHPKTGGIATVPTSSIPIHERKGWVLNEPAAPPPTEDVPDASSDATTDETHEENN